MYDLVHLYIKYSKDFRKLPNLSLFSKIHVHAPTRQVAKEIAEKKATHESTDLI